MRQRALQSGFLPFLAVFVFGVWQVQGERISEIKCKEYQAKTYLKQATIWLTLNPRPLEHLSYNCSKTVELIVGGEAAKPHEFPHHAIIGWPREDDSDEYEFRCGGTLISDWFVLTAAHCFNEDRQPEIVRLGEHNLADDDKFHADFPIADIILHNDYNSSRSYYDIALIKLEHKVNFVKSIRPACLWTGTSFNFTKVVATGFGLDSFAGDPNDVLQKVELDVMETERCVTQYRGDRKFKSGIMDSQICIGSHRRNKDTCQGDSGGPVQVVTDEKGCMYHVVGITSTGGNCGSGSSIYTRVSSFVDWIENLVWN
ncbi:serine protease snake-like [Uranotaenia lowii]|uniref:serine protease snake-like n=1 Tax=Uranotaenia lowii TaxID=190385 RepID=UPI00247B12C7|nr:serine protease snake-like [Uranotaenia lowii]